jgi:hypothetical protein
LLGSGDLTAEFDALFEISVPIEPDALVEISVPIFGRLATPKASRTFLFLKSPQVSIAAFAMLGANHDRARALSDC